MFLFCSFALLVKLWDLNPDIPKIVVFKTLLDVVMLSIKAF